MHPIFHETRSRIAHHAEQWVKQESERMARNAHNMMHSANQKTERLIAVTESYLKRGYHEIHGWDGPVGDYHHGSTYCRKLAYSLRRPYIQISTHNYQVEVKMPKYKRFAPIIAPILLLAATDQRDPVVMVHPMSSLYHITITRTSPSGPDAIAWEPFVAWKARLDTDPEWRRLIRANNILPQR